MVNFGSEVVMGKKYLVEEIDTEVEFGVIKVIVPIIGFGLAILVNYSFLKSVIENIQDMGHIDSESLGILIGVFLSLLIGLVIFIINRYRGVKEASTYSFFTILITSIFLMWLGSMIVPPIAYYHLYHELVFTMGDFFKTLIFNFIFLALCSPLVALLGTIIVTILGYLLSIPCYKIIYWLKSKNIQKTKCVKEIQKLCQKIDMKEKIVQVHLYQDKVEFYINSFTKYDEISFTKLGYSDLKPLSQLTLLHIIEKIAKIKLTIVERNFKNGKDVLIADNRYLRKKLIKNSKELNTMTKKCDLLFEKIEKRKAKEKKRAYKKAVKEGKDW